MTRVNITARNLEGFPLARLEVCVAYQEVYVERLRRQGGRGNGGKGENSSQFLRGRGSTEKGTRARHASLEETGSRKEGTRDRERKRERGERVR